MLRIITGHWKGQKLSAPTRGTRPSASRSREALFDVLAHREILHGARVLDLYAGSGALGVEALSRGAAQAVFVEAHPLALRTLRENLRRLRPPPTPAQARVIPARVEAWLARPNPDSPFDLALLDAPYALDSSLALAQLSAAAWLQAQAWIVVETRAGKALQTPPGLEPIDEKRYGDTALWFYRVREQNISASKPQQLGVTSGAAPLGARF